MSVALLFGLSFALYGVMATVFVPPQSFVFLK